VTERSGRALLAGSILALVAWMSCGAAAGATDSPPLLSPAHPASGSFEPAAAAVFRVEAAAGSFRRVTVRQRGHDLVVRLLDPAGTPVAFRDSRSGAYGAEVLSFVAALDGEYQVVVSNLFPETTRSELTIELVDAHAAGEADTRRVAAEEQLSSAGDSTVAMVARLERCAASAQAFRELGDARSEGLAHHSAARILLNAGVLPQATAELESALAAYRRADDRYQAGLALLDLGVVASTAGDPTRARRWLERALEPLGGGRAPCDEAEARVAVAWTDFQSGRLQAAIEQASRALALARGRCVFAEAFALNHRGFFHWLVGAPGAALEDLERALPLARALEGKGPWVSGFVLVNLAWTHYFLGDHGEAHRFAREALALQRRQADRFGESISLSTLATFELEAERFDEAETLADEALAVAREVSFPQGKYYALMARAAVERSRGDRGGGRSDLDAALEVAERAGNPEWRAAAHGGLARAAAERDDLPGALQEIEAAVGEVEALRGESSDRNLRLLLFSSRQAYFELEVDILMRLDARDHGAGWDRRALAASEAGRARGLRDRLRAMVGLDDEAGPEVAVPSRLLDADTRLLEYELGDERSYLWVVGPESTTSFVLPGRGRIEATVDHFLRLLGAQDRRATERQRQLAARELSDLLLAPAAGLLDRARLAFVPDGRLQLLPWAALPDPGGLAGGEPDAPLIETHEIVRLPSLAVLAELRAAEAHRRPPSLTLAVLADPVLAPDDPRLAAGAGDASRPGREVGDRRGDPPSAPARNDGPERLAGSLAEVSALRAFSQASRRFEALGFDANLDAVERPEVQQARVVHFAVHAFADERWPDRSGIQLSAFTAEGRPRQGLLPLSRLYSLDLAADLVVLSACRTAAGPVVAGEGTLSLSRAFLHDGVPRVVAALWDVDDRATARLMESFYRALLGEGRSVPEALRLAQLELRRDPRFRHPVFWAGFVVDGDWR
jgi:CHAT domain-containing protein/tetratricopeptide (TPR) repeat protein